MPQNEKKLKDQFYHEFNSMKQKKVILEEENESKDSMISELKMK
jgi:hypothetical protein